MKTFKHLIISIIAVLTLSACGSSAENQQEQAPEKVVKVSTEMSEKANSQKDELSIAKADYENFKVKHKDVIAKNKILNPNAPMSEQIIMANLIRKGLTILYIEDGTSKKTVDICWNEFAPEIDSIGQCVEYYLLRKPM